MRCSERHVYVGSILICIAEMKGMAANVWVCAYEGEREREMETTGALSVMNPEFNDPRDTS